MAEDMKRWRAAVNAVMEPQIQWNIGRFMSSCQMDMKRVVFFDSITTESNLNFKERETNKLWYQRF
jgi:hypothetical protein